MTSKRQKNTTETAPTLVEIAQAISENLEGFLDDNPSVRKQLYGRRTSTISGGEWNEITRLTAIREMWDLKTDASAELVGQAFATKITIGDKGRTLGDLFVLQNKNEPDQQPMILIRDYATEDHNNPTGCLHVL